MTDEPSAQNQPIDESCSSPPPRPAWVKTLAIVAAVIVVVLLLSKLLGADHGPGRHSGTGSSPVQQVTGL